MFWLAAISRHVERLPMQMQHPCDLVIGRGGECGLRVVDTTISRRHAQIFSTAHDSFHIRDLGSSNGTQVNGKRVTKAKLDPGAEIMLGGVRFIFAVAKDAAELEELITDEDTYRAEQELEERLDLIKHVLTRAQLDVVRLMLEGLSEPQMASQLHRSPTTIHNHVQSIFRRMNVHSRAELIRTLLHPDYTSVLRSIGNNDQAK